MILLDSSAWIEIFRGTILGKKIEERIKSEKLCASVVSISEIAKWCVENKLDQEIYINIIEKSSTLLPLKREILINAGVFCVAHKKVVHNWGMLDSLIYMTALDKSLSVLTTDHHFKDLESVELVE